VPANIFRMLRHVEASPTNAEEVRGRLWLWAVGNAANATAAAYEAHTQRLMPLLERRRSGGGQRAAARAHKQEPATATATATATHCCSHQETREHAQEDPQDLDYVNIDTPTVDSCPHTPTSPPSSSARYSDTHSSSPLYCDTDTGTGCVERVGQRQSDRRNTCNMSAAEAPPAQQIPSHTRPSASTAAASAHARVQATRTQDEAICTQHTDNQHAHAHAHAHADADNQDASGHVRLEATAPEPTPHMHIMRNTSPDEPEDEDKTRQVHNKQQQSRRGRQATDSDETEQPAEAEEAEEAAERLVEVASAETRAAAAGTQFTCFTSALVKQRTTDCELKWRRWTQTRWRIGLCLTRRSGRRHETWSTFHRYAWT